MTRKTKELFFMITLWDVMKAWKASTRWVCCLFVVLIFVDLLNDFRWKSTGFVDEMPNGASYNMIYIFLCHFNIKITNVSYPFFVGKRDSYFYAKCFTVSLILIALAIIIIAYVLRWNKANTFCNLFSNNLKNP